MAAILSILAKTSCRATNHKDMCLVPRFICRIWAIMIEAMALIIVITAIRAMEAQEDKVRVAIKDTLATEDKVLTIANKVAEVKNLILVVTNTIHETTIAIKT